MTFKGYKNLLTDALICQWKWNKLITECNKISYHYYDGINMKILADTQIYTRDTQKINTYINK